MVKSSRYLLVMGAAASIFVAVPAAQAAPVTGTWVITNGQADADVVAGTENTNSPRLAPQAPSLDVSGTTFQSAFPTITLTNPGHFIEVTGAIDLERVGSEASLASLNRLNDQLRVGLFGAPSAPTEGASGDPRGFIAEYGSSTVGNPGEIRGLIATQANPFSGSTATPVIAGAGNDPEGDSLSGTPVSANFVFRLTRQAGNTLDITGNFNGVTVDPLDNDYLQPFSVLGHTPDASFDFSLNRLAFLIGGNADAASGGLQNIDVTTNVPEPASLALLGLGGLAFLRRRRA